MAPSVSESSDVVAGDDTAFGISGITMAFGANVVLDGVSLAVPEGQALGIIGPNGAGKSTMLDIITGEKRAQQGSVRLAGTDVTRFPARRRCLLGLGRSHQIPRPFAGLTVLENVLVGAFRGSGLRSAEASDGAVAALERTGLIHRANDLAEDMALLDRKRLELARALATRPSVLLLDEIAGGLTDPETASLLELLHELKASGLTIVWVEHVVRALVQLVERVVCLASGGFIADGPPGEVMRAPQVVEAYMGKTSRVIL